MFEGVLNTPLVIVRTSQITVGFYRYYEPKTAGEGFRFFTEMPEKYLPYIFVLYRKFLVVINYFILFRLVLPTSYNQLSANNGSTYAKQ